MLSCTDTHAHLSLLAERGIDPAARLEELAAAGFGSILDVGTREDDLRGRIDAFSRFPSVRFSAGIWPSAEAIRDRKARVGALRRSAAAAPPGLLAAVGECGFDRRWNRAEDGADVRGERELFEEQARLSLELGLPLVVHSREAAAETAEAIASVGGLRGAIHCFSYGQEEAERFLELGFHLSFAGTITYRGAELLREALRRVPDDRLLLETDCPYLAPAPFRGRSAEPGMVSVVYEAAAALRGTTPDHLAETVAGNARALFGLPTKS